MEWQNPSQNVSVLILESSINSLTSLIKELAAKSKIDTKRWSQSRWTHVIRRVGNYLKGKRLNSGFDGWILINSTDKMIQGQTKVVKGKKTLLLPML